MEPDKMNPSRKKFISWGAAALSSLIAWKLLPAKKAEEKKTIKMLAQDGTLVEVDAEKVYGSRRKRISPDQLKNWIKKQG